MSLQEGAVTSLSAPRGADLEKSPADVDLESKVISTVGSSSEML